MKVIITGGHITPAMAVIDELLKRGADVLIAGRMYTNLDKTDYSFEYQEATRKKIPFVNIDAGKLSRYLSRSSLIFLKRIPRGFIEAKYLIDKEKPDIIISFGGYIALPVTIIGFIKKIPIYTHEQTIMPGIANRLIGNLAKKIFISFPQSKKFFSEKKTLLTGNPIRSEILSKNHSKINISQGKPVILVLGGSLGSHYINSLIEANIEKLLQKYVIIHQTGDVSQFNDYNRLAKITNKCYVVKRHLIGADLGVCYNLCDLVISRAGANTVFELIRFDKPAILIPLPGSAGNEQFLHARLLEKAGVAKIYRQESSPSVFIEMVETVMGKKEVFSENHKKLKYLDQQNAAAIIVDTVYD